MSRRLRSQRTRDRSVICTSPSANAYAGGCRCEQCTAANTAKQKAYYQTAAGKRAARKSENKRIAEARKWVARQKASWCLDCGYVGPPEAMDFDHRPGEDKVFGLAEMVKRRISKVKMAREILKCDLVCANCHRIRTAARHREAVAH